MTARCRPTPSPFASAETDTGVAVARCARRGRRGQSSKNTSTTSRWRRDIGTRRRRCAAHPATCPARKPPCRGGGAPEHGSDLVERQGEHVVQDERQPFGWPRCACVMRDDPPKLAGVTRQFEQGGVTRAASAGAAFRRSEVTESAACERRQRAGRSQARVSSILAGHISAGGSNVAGLRRRPFTGSEPGAR
jgi:hypothetical protein